MIGRSGLAMLQAGVSMPAQAQGEPAANAKSLPGNMELDALHATARTQSPEGNLTVNLRAELFTMHSDNNAVRGRGDTVSSTRSLSRKLRSRSSDRQASGFRSKWNTK